MKFAIVAVCIIGWVAASSPDQVAQVIRNDYQQSPEGNFQYNYETDNGIAAQATGALKQIGKDAAAVVVQGSTQYKSDNGEVLQLTYTADENGYQPQASYLPTPPAPEPIPDYILRAIDYIKAHPYVEKKQ